MKKEVTTNEILDVLIKFAKSTDERFDKIDLRFKVIESDVSELKVDMAMVKSQMVTKHYLDDKFANLRGELIQIIDRKIEIACT